MPAPSDTALIIYDYTLVSSYVHKVIAGKPVTPDERMLGIKSSFSNLLSLQTPDNFPLFYSRLKQTLEREANDISFLTAQLDEGDLNNNHEVFDLLYVLSGMINALADPRELQQQFPTAVDLRGLDLHIKRMRSLFKEPMSDLTPLASGNKREKAKEVLFGFFDRLARYQALEYFEQNIVDHVRASSIMAVPRIKKYLKEWQDARAEPTAQPEINPEVRPETIEEVIVPDLLPQGQRDSETIGGPEVTDPEGTREIKTEPRDRWLREALEGDPRVDKQKTRIYVDPLGHHDTRGEVYKIVDIVLITGERMQVAVCNSVGNATFAWKSVLNYPDDAGVITQRDLQEDMYVQRVICKDKDTWIKDIMALAYKPHERWEPQVKTSVRWSNKGALVVEAVRAFAAQHGGAMPTRDSGIVRYETPYRDQRTLNCKTRWDLVHDALDRGAIADLKEFKTLDALTRHLASGRPVPVLDSV